MSEPSEFKMNISAGRAIGYENCRAKRRYSHVNQGVHSEIAKGVPSAHRCLGMGRLRSVLLVAAVFAAECALSGDGDAFGLGHVPWTSSKSANLDRPEVDGFAIERAIFVAFRATSHPQIYYYV